jgi:hypothetical protein
MDGSLGRRKGCARLAHLLRWIWRWNEFLALGWIRCLRDVGALVVGVHARYVDRGEAEAVLGLYDGPVLARTGMGKARGRGCGMSCFERAVVF